MSHQIKVESKLKNLNLLKRALKTMGISNIKENCVPSHSSTKCDIVADNAVGFQKMADGTYQVVGDPYYCPNGSPLNKFYGKNQDLRLSLSEAYLMEQAKTDVAKVGMKLHPETMIRNKNKTVQVTARAIQE